MNAIPHFTRRHHVQLLGIKTFEMIPKYVRRSRNRMLLAKKIDTASFPIHPPLRWTINPMAILYLDSREHPSASLEVRLQVVFWFLER